MAERIFNLEQAKNYLYKQIKTYKDYDNKLIELNESCIDKVLYILRVYFRYINILKY
jgi:hypothetical protein